MTPEERIAALETRLAELEAVCLRLYQLSEQFAGETKQILKAHSAEIDGLVLRGVTTRKVS